MHIYCLCTLGYRKKLKYTTKIYMRRLDISKGTQSYSTGNLSHYESIWIQSFVYFLMLMFMIDNWIVNSMMYGWFGPQAWSFSQVLLHLPLMFYLLKDHIQCKDGVRDIYRDWLMGEIAHVLICHISQRRWLNMGIIRDKEICNDIIASPKSLFRINILYD